MLDRSNFTKIAGGGFGDPHNSHAWSMEWFKDSLYVGTSRDILWLFARMGNYAYLDPYPVSLPPLAEMDLRAQIWRYTPGAGPWEHVYTSPLIPWRRMLRARRMLGRRHGHRAVIRGLLSLGRQWVSAGFKIETARDVGYRNMAVYTDTHGSEALYVVGIGTEGHLLRSTDGTTFEVITGLRGRADVAFGYRPLVCFRGRLYTSAAGHPMLSGASAYPAVLETDDPARGAVEPAVWRPVSAPGFGDPTNLSIFEMAVFRDHLYAGTANLNGFQIWKTDASGSAPYRWTSVMKDGGHRDPLGPPVVISMCPFGEWLYLGSGRAPSALETLDPAPGELIRIAPDDTWEIVAGEPRETPQGFKVPISGMGPGFGNPFAMYVWRLEQHNGWLYAGVNDVTTMLRYTPRDRLGPDAARWVDQHGGVEQTVEAEGGFDLWRTQDGSRWTCVTRTGFGNPYNNGVRTLKSTRVGLFVGTMNFFTEARDPVTGEPRGGAEIWLGSA